ncbi:ABC transporter transmembrane domain-containing protein [Dongia rigui]|uniref:ABC transporter transmembrane domain-containing protein n=1 Tax=Dongia rigui TaxID=940149 RepID=A0ABU5DV56_9PROT|nr:ABC transporter transmembrane domain-containing protein [Dongia rigui]MDY0871196.1 ABC transporter transmembrane domain-containing protein [Dongia rigui]
MARGGANLPDRPTSREIRRLSDLLRFVSPYRWRVIGGTLALLVTASTVLALGSGMRYLVDRGFGLGDPHILDQTVAALFAVTVVMAVATYARFYFVTWVGERVVADIRKAVFDHIVSLSPGFFEITRTGEVVSRLTTDTTLLQTVVGSSASIALRNTIMMVGATVMLFITSPKLTGLVFLVVPFVVAPIIIYGRKVRVLSRLSQDKIAEVSADANESLYGIRTVQAFAHETEERKRFGSRVEESFDAATDRIRARALLTALVILLVFGAISIVLWIGGADVLAGSISAGQLSAFVFYAIVVAGSLGAITEVVGDLQRAAGAMERIIELLNTQPIITAPALPKYLPKPLTGRIKFEGVSFQYPSRPEQTALENFTLEIQPGETVAIVGPSGAGKTTVMQLLMRFYDPDAGRITLDGIDIRDVVPQDLRSAMGLVPQDPVIFSSSAAENILYGRPDADRTAIRQAADAAHATEFLDRLPQGFDTHLGERGVRLSGGQRQRIAIARAVLRNPTLLLLDEATSALDAESEQLVQAALDKLMVGRTTLVIAHRLATVLKANRIVVIDKGRIDAIGTHAELIRQGGLYARLAELQFDQPKKSEPEAAA